ncbi:MULTISPECIES: hypothetical protein [unclassified Streptomyces]|uniref:hypothetical protein n=1 Tax=unclassified Streptomyces TaxID=2593676 RepID=UPI00225AD047|nr:MULTISPECIES: hypothetical protein [unclassified Streptomyces]MCX5139840.1 hypothetical protein [Streptomyces sp. NBC_00338]WRZ64491.1 hypothetical protein OG408_11580 [Streptomyces sp. NBC_01257]WSU58454.1 hypothetical protein OG450_11545 [Streptomyces sp. NBC_01104]
MTEVLVVLGLLFTTIVFLVVKLTLKERRRRTENFDGQQIERHHSAEIRDIRAANTSIAVHNRLIDGGNDWRPRKR